MKRLWCTEDGMDDAAFKSDDDYVRVSDVKELLDKCRSACLAVGSDAEEAAKAKDATGYVAGYQDAAVDCDEELRLLAESI